MTKADLIDEVSKVSNLTKKETELIVNTVFDNITDALAKGDKVELRGFGSFRIRHRNSRKGRNPRPATRERAREARAVLQGRQAPAGARQHLAARSPRGSSAGRRGGWAYVSVRAGDARRPRLCLLHRARRRRRSAGPHPPPRRSSAFLILNAFPYASGHLMAGHRAHVGAVGGRHRRRAGRGHGARPGGRARAQTRLQARRLQCRREPRPVAGAGVLDHLHVHVVPRWNGDTNFMPVIADTRVARPRRSTTTYDRLSAALARDGRLAAPELHAR